MKKIKNLSTSFSIIIILFLISSCKLIRTNSIKSDKLGNITKPVSINISSLVEQLLNADRNLIPVLSSSGNGQKFYRYKKFPGDEDLTISEIEEWMNKGSDFFKGERVTIKEILNKINNLGINNDIVKIENGAWGLWIPGKNKLLIDAKVVKMGSKIFLDVLRHESIHVAQSCHNGSKNSFPKRIGLPLEFSQEINLNLYHKLYSKNSKEDIFMEREAFTYSKIEGAAIKLLDKFCY